MKKNKKQLRCSVNNLDSRKEFKTDISSQMPKQTPLINELHSKKANQSKNNPLLRH